MSLPLATISLTSSLAFGIYRNCLQCMSQARGGNGPNTKPEVFLSGLIAGMAQVLDAKKKHLETIQLQVSRCS